MCGIFGVISQNKIDSSRLKQVSSTIKHRGPDDEGYLLFNIDQYYLGQFSNYSIADYLNNPDLNVDHNFNAAFLHRRLSILDLSSAGHQPMSFNNDNYWITYNGEVYNYLELRKELEAEGFIFITNTDTEIILASYVKWGTSCVNKFNGMWAFAIWDRIKGVIFLSNDRFGIKPLYYLHKNGEFIFSSEIKGIRSYLKDKLEINEYSVFKYLYKGEFTVGEDEDTMFEGVKRIIPGHNLVYKNRTIHDTEYWNLRTVENNNSFDENVSRFRELFRDSIKLRLRSDVEVGSCLSGGIDSSSIVSCAVKDYSKTLHTFSAIWPGEKCDESFYIDKVNTIYNCHPHAFRPDTQNVLLDLEAVIWHQEMPIAGSSILAQWYVMKKAKKNNIKVLLDGQGADEIVGGYPRYVRTYLDEMIRTFNFQEIIKHYASLRQNNYSLRRIFGINKKLFIPSRQNPLLPLKSNYLKKYEERISFNNYKFNNLYEHLKSELKFSCLPTLLHIEDRNSMAHSVESRVPFLDYRLVEFSFSVPAKQKINGALTKMLIRESMKNYLPPEIYKRTDKIGFSTPIESQLFNGKVNYTIDALKNSARITPILKFVDLEKVTDKYLFKIYSITKFYELWG